MRVPQNRGPRSWAGGVLGLLPNQLGTQDCFTEEVRLGLLNFVVVNLCFLPKFSISFILYSDSQVYLLASGEDCVRVVCIQA